MFFLSIFPKFSQFTLLCRPFFVRTWHVLINNASSTATKISVLVSCWFPQLSWQDLPTSSAKFSVLEHNCSELWSFFFSFLFWALIFFFFFFLFNHQRILKTQETLHCKATGFLGVRCSYSLCSGLAQKLPPAQHPLRCLPCAAAEPAPAYSPAAGTAPPAFTSCRDKLSMTGREKGGL